MDEVNKILIINYCQNNIILIVCEHFDVRNQIRYSKTMERRQPSATQRAGPPSPNMSRSGAL